MANTNDFFADIFNDIPDAGDDMNFDDIFGDEPAKEESKPQNAAPAPEQPKEAVTEKVEEAASEVEETIEDAIAEVDEQAAEAISDTAKVSTEADQKIAELQQESLELTDQKELANENGDTETTAQVEAAEEALQTEINAAIEAKPAAEEASTETTIAVKEEAAKAEAVEEPAEEEPVVEVETKAKKTRKPRAKKAKAAIEGEIITEHSNEITPEFMSSLLLVPGQEFVEDKTAIEKLMSEITLEPGMSDAVVETMVAKNLLLLQKIEEIAYGYHVAYENLTNKETGLIKRVQENAMLTAEGTEKDKKLAASVAVANYEYKKGHKVDLYQYANALRGADYFVKRASEFQKSTSIALSTYRKRAA